MIKSTLVCLLSVAVVLAAAPARSAPPEPARVRRLEGTLTKVSDESISIQPVRRGEEKAGIEWTVAVDEKTRVVRSIPNDKKGRGGARGGYRTEPAELSDLAVGQHVRVKADAERAEEVNIVVPPERGRSGAESASGGV